MDGAFYRGNATEQSNKFSDKEKKLLREMKFEKQLETEVNLKKIDINVIKPWVTQKLTTLLGMEDDVVNEYVFSQLEEKQLNPKIMQINLTGFLNARRAREFMGELWQLLIEAQNSADGIPMSLVQKKIEELKANDQKPDDAVNIDLKDTSSNWNNRYQSLTYGKYKPQVKEEPEDEDETMRRRSVSPKPRSSNDRDKERRRRDRSESPDRRSRRKRDDYDDQRRRDDDDRHRDRRHRRRRDDDDEDDSRRRRKRSRTPEKRKKSKRDSPERRRRRSRSRTPERREKKRSRSPRRRERKRSPSSERRERSKSDDS